MPRFHPFLVAIVIFWVNYTSQSSRTQLLLILTVDDVFHPNWFVGKLLEEQLDSSQRSTETYNTDISEKKDLDHKILRWLTKLYHSTDEKLGTFTKTLWSSTLIWTFIPAWSQSLPSSSIRIGILKTYSRSTIKTERLLPLSLKHA